MLKTVLENPWVRAVGVLLGIGAVCFLCWFLRPVLVPLFLAFLLAYVFDPVVDIFEKRGISRSVAIGCLALVLVVVVLSVPLYVIPQALEEADRLSASSGEAQSSESRLSKALDGISERLPAERLLREAGWLETGEVVEDSQDIRRALARGIGNLARENGAHLMQGLFRAGETTGTTVANIFASVGRGTAGVAAFLGNLVLFGFVAVYLLKDFDVLIQKSGELVPPRYRARTFDIVGRIDVQIRSFLRGQALVCLCLGIMYVIGMKASGVPFGVIIGVFGGVASFVPYLGIMLTIGPAVILVLLQHGLSGHLAGVLATFIIAQSIEGSILTPKIVGDQVGLNPVWVILAIMVFSSTLGFLGLLLAVPMAAALKVLVVEAVGYYKSSSIFDGTGGSSGSSST